MSTLFDNKIVPIGFIGARPSSISKEDKPYRVFKDVIEVIMGFLPSKKRFFGCFFRGFSSNFLIMLDS
jgi:hypothetical protein